MIFLTGASGFIGLNLIKFFKNEYSIIRYKRDLPISINENIVIHLAGKAHDIKKKLIINQYYQVNTELTKKVFDAFLESDAKVFITISSVKAVANEVHGELIEDCIANPITHYGKSKLLAENYILSKKIPINKRVYVLRPCMIYGNGTKGNLELLFRLVNKGFPWPLGAYDNKRSYCSIENLLFIIKEIIKREDIPSGVYNVADDETISTNELISIIAKAQNKKVKILKVSKILIKLIAKLGDILYLPFTTERLLKLTESYVVNNEKIKTAIGKSLPTSTKEAMLKTFKNLN
jgi:nucleoside-diphosphate-sugar epimerase